MAKISADDKCLTVLNLFETDTHDGQERLLEAMRDIIDTADYPGWMSSTLHSGEGRFGTANYIQWRSVEDLEARYTGEKFRHETVPLFKELSTSIKLLKAEVVFTQRNHELVETEISPDRDDYTVVMVMGVDPKNQKLLVDLFSQPDEWIKTVPGYRSHSILQGVDGTFVVNYAQWSDKDSYETFHALPEDVRPAAVREMRVQARALVTSRDANTYRVCHTRSARV
jgi:heme-degrading monooxygenase HmoA